MVKEEKLAWSLRLKKSWAAGAAALAFIATAGAELLVAQANAKVAQCAVASAKSRKAERKAAELAAEMALGHTQVLIVEMEI